MVAGALLVVEPGGFLITEALDRTPRAAGIAIAEPPRNPLIGPAKCVQVKRLHCFELRLDAPWTGQTFASTPATRRPQRTPTAARLTCICLGLVYADTL